MKIKVKITGTIANEYMDRCPEDIPEHIRDEGVFTLDTDTARAVLADAEFMGDTRNGPEEMRPAVRRAYQCLAENIRKALA